MTFEETMSSWFPKGFKNYEGNLDEGDLKCMWNAAIEAAMKTLRAESYEFNVHPEEDIKYLLSK